MLRKYKTWSGATKTKQRMRIKIKIKIDKTYGLANNKASVKLLQNKYNID